MRTIDLSSTLPSLILAISLNRTTGRHNWLAVSIGGIRYILVVKNSILGSSEFACVTIRFGGVIRTGGRDD
jgi:hypothetical protein